LKDINDVKGFQESQETSWLIGPVGQPRAIPNRPSEGLPEKWSGIHCCLWQKIKTHTCFSMVLLPVKDFKKLMQNKIDYFVST
jgi:hypothetical protein